MELLWLKLYGQLFMVFFNIECVGVWGWFGVCDVWCSKLGQLWLRYVLCWEVLMVWWYKVYGF